MPYLSVNHPIIATILGDFGASLSVYRVSFRFSLLLLSKLPTWPPASLGIQQSFGVRDAKSRVEPSISVWFTMHYFLRWEHQGTRGKLVHGDVATANMTSRGLVPLDASQKILMPPRSQARHPSQRMRPVDFGAI